MDTPATTPACLIIGTDDHVGAYLARLLDARGLALAALASDGRLLARLGIADAVASVADGDLAAAVADARLVFAIGDGSAERADTLARALYAAAAAPAPPRLIHVADVADLAAPAVRDSVRRVAAARAGGVETANVLLESHDSRFGRRDTLTARIIAAAGSAEPTMTTIIETGPRDWGWTPEYVDAVQRLATRERLVDMVVASGHTLTAAEIADAAFGYFRRRAADHIRIEGTGSAVAAIDPAALKAATGWSASTWGRDLVRALCEGAADRG
ncbi:GDP-mannose 4,6-dehydratase [Polymorphobacter fuscus]|uniref:NAD(P)-binding domain-containing protein n=1 Tax=Sandarakinorhabdus fusca TaxID=1439888 RepID=A0A7C9GZ23_9SPHN|nr:GDP-mannose 4,6-dehydratase [Polymorphobacter fuscus]KAB7644376.1 hypothetical protein F9290_13620 [Polymorphobacter fuscus]MQT18294.1 hypothetical protein [Polymorphobacter fuscus]NJC08188.1 hypothetical protein [Polymorphobacter fuscus]